MYPTFTLSMVAVVLMVLACSFTPPPSTPTPLPSTPTVENLQAMEDEVDRVVKEMSVDCQNSECVKTAAQWLAYQCGENGYSGWWDGCPAAVIIEIAGIKCQYDLACTIRGLKERGLIAANP